MAEKAECVPVEPAEVDEIAAMVRQADIEEITGALGIPIREALLQGITDSLKVSKIVAAGEVVAVFGDAVHSVLGRIGVPWLISTTAIERQPRAFLRVCAGEVADMLTRHDVLFNYVDARNTAAIRWLKWLGFQFDDPEPYGPNGMPFHRFWMTKPCA